MASYQMAWKASTRVVTIQAKDDALPAGAVKIGEFKHDDTQDGLGASNVNENHVFYHHVRDALYKVGEQNMQTVSIVPTDVLTYGGNALTYGGSVLTYSGE